MTASAISNGDRRSLSPEVLKPKKWRVLAGPSLGVGITVVPACIILGFCFFYRVPFGFLFPSILVVALIGVIFAALGLVKLARAQYLKLTPAGFTLGYAKTIDWKEIASIEDHWVNNVKGGRYRDGVEITFVSSSDCLPLVIPQIYCRNPVELKSLLRSYWRTAVPDAALP